MQRPYNEKCETADETSGITWMGLGDVNTGSSLRKEKK
jgi:hypothetical protein